MTSSDEGPSTHTGDPRLAEIEKSLRRGNYLRGDQRPLSRILEEDAAEVTRVGMDLDDVTSNMKRLYDLGRKGLGDTVIVDGVFEVTVREERGILASPWGDQFAAPKATVTAVNLTTGKTLTFSILGWHLIRCYGFFQGITFAVGAGLGLTLALVLMASIRESVEFSDVPGIAKGTALVLIIAGTLSMAFMGFAGLL